MVVVLFQYKKSCSPIIDFVYTRGYTKHRPNTRLLYAGDGHFHRCLKLTVFLSESCLRLDKFVDGCKGVVSCAITENKCCNKTHVFYLTVAFICLQFWFHVHKIK